MIVPPAFLREDVVNFVGLEPRSSVFKCLITEEKIEEISTLDLSRKKAGPEIDPA